MCTLLCHFNNIDSLTLFENGMRMKTSLMSGLRGEFLHKLKPCQLILRHQTRLKIKTSVLNEEKLSHTNEPKIIRPD